MHRRFRELILKSAGVARDAVVTFLDIRSFSRFCENRESPSISTYLSRVYQAVLDDYFPDADFYKPTGDGLLLIHHYAADSVDAVCGKVVRGCVSLLDKFPTLVQNDRMINFPTPDRVGFGITRGVICQLRSGDEVLDYSGRLINLAARLQTLAHPSGIVISDTFLSASIPDELRPKFEQQSVFLRGIAEDTPCRVFVLRDQVQVPPEARSPLSQVRPVTAEVCFTPYALARLPSRFRLALPKRPRDPRDIRVEIEFPEIHDQQVSKTYTSVLKLDDWSYDEASTVPYLEVDLDFVRSALDLARFPQRRKCVFARAVYRPVVDAAV